MQGIKEIGVYKVKLCHDPYLQNSRKTQTYSYDNKVKDEGG